MKATSPMFIHYVHDMGRAVAFYRDVFGVPVSFESPGWSTLSFDSFELALHILAPGQQAEQPIPHAGIVWLVDSIEEARARIEAHGGSMRDLREPDAFVPVRVASFVDPEGNGFDLRQDPASAA